MIELNGKTLAPVGEPLGDSVGFYKRSRGQINILNPELERVGVISRKGVLAKASKLDKGYWYSYGTIEIIGEYSYRQQCEEVLEIMEKR